MNFSKEKGFLCVRKHSSSIICGKLIVLEFENHLTGSYLLWACIPRHLLEQLSSEQRVSLRILQSLKLFFRVFRPRTPWLPNSIKNFKFISWFSAQWILLNLANSLDGSDIAQKSHRKSMRTLLRVWGSDFVCCPKVGNLLKGFSSESRKLLTDSQRHSISVSSNWLLNLLKLGSRFTWFLASTFSSSVPFAYLTRLN